MLKNLIVEKLTVAIDALYWPETTLTMETDGRDVTVWHRNILVLKRLWRHSETKLYCNYRNLLLSHKARPLCEAD